MSGPVDLSNLHDLTGGDAGVELELFKVFLEEAAANYDGLSASLSKPEDWRRYAHALKGISRNLGAARLGDLCYEAQQGFQAEQNEKTRILANIEAEFLAVKGFLAPMLR